MKQTAYFGAGCFWGVEHYFMQQAGILSTKVGYMGGHLEEPTYEEVVDDTTGHAEVVEVEFDDSVMSYAALCDLFFACHNPTTLNRQGDDVGTRYRSVIFYTNEDQAAEARVAISRCEQSGKWSNPIVTTVEPATKFWKAESYHQQYIEKRGITSCHI